MKIGIIDADLIGRDHHRFPNLACLKISAYHKEIGDEVTLLTSYEDIDQYDQVYISKVFTDTPFPAEIKENDKIHLGGTGFYFDKAANLPDEIEHHMPDYHLYDDWIEEQVKAGRKYAEDRGKTFNEAYFRSQFKEYTDYSIGFLTRGCFRKCGFCVNKKYDHVFLHSPLEEFYDPDRKKVCLLDDNFFGCGQWKPKLQELIDLNKPFKFKQGLDERILTDEKCEILFNNSLYDSDFTFAFDNIADYDKIHDKLRMIRRHTDSSRMRFYVLVGYESIDIEDIRNAFRRIALLQQYKCLPYIMRYQNKNETPWKNSAWRGMYITLARWCNQPYLFKMMSFRTFCERNQENIQRKGHYAAAMKALLKFEQEDKAFADQYFDRTFNWSNDYGE